MKIEGSLIHNSKVLDEKCKKYLKLIKKKKIVDLEAIGSKPNNDVLDLLRCQNKQMVRKIKNNIDANDCSNIEKMYTKCHSSVMGTGNFEGRKNCGDELQSFLDCTIEL